MTKFHKCFVWGNERVKWYISFELMEHEGGPSRELCFLKRGRKEEQMVIIDVNVVDEVERWSPSASLEGPLESFDSRGRPFVIIAGHEIIRSPSKFSENL